MAVRLRSVDFARGPWDAVLVCLSIGVPFHNRSSEQDRRTIGLYMEVFPITLRVTAANIAVHVI